MPRYFMHLVDSTDVTLDPHGTEMTPDGVAGAALLAARDCLAGDVKNGMLDFRYRIDVHDDAGDTVHRLAFRDALRIFGL
jgi:hypothetical protein